MKRYNILLSALAIFGIFIAACSPSKGSVSLSTPQAGAATTQAPGGLPDTGSQNGATTQNGNNKQSAQTPYPSIQSTQAITPTQQLPPGQPAHSTSPPQVGQQNNATSNPQFVSGHLSDLLQLQVQGQNNQSIGSVQNMVLDLKNLKVEYVIMSLDPSLGASGEQVVVPWSMLKLESSGSQGGQGVFIFNSEQQKLAGAPQFNPDNFPKLGQPAGNWDASIRSYWGLEQGSPSNGNGGAGTPAAPSGTQAPSQQTENTGLQGVVLANQVLAYHLNASNGQQIAEVKDLILDPNSGELQYVLISINGLPGAYNNEIIPVPLRALSWDPQNNTIKLNVPPQVLLNAPKFAQGQLPSTTNPNWDSEIRSFWQQYLQPQVPQQ